MSEAAAPVSRTERIAMLDTTRGIAVLGILLMNITGFGLPHAYDDPTNWGGATGANLTAYRITSLFFEGTMRGLFTFLFGAGALLFLSRHISQDRGLRPADLYFRRTLWLIVFGLVNGYLLLWEGDILFFYGVVGLFLFVFRDLSPQRLLLIAIAALSMQTVMFAMDRADYFEAQAEAQAAEAQLAAGAPLLPGQRQAIDAFREMREDFKPSRKQLAADVAAMREDYASAFGVVMERTFGFETWFLFRYGFMESLGMMLLGMVLFKVGILDGRAPARGYVVYAIAGYTIGLAINVFELVSLERAGFSVAALLTSYLTYDAGRIPMTLGHVGLIGLLCRASILAPINAALASVGQMALTNYLAQSVICAIVFTGVGFGLFGQLQRYELYYVVAAIWCVQLIWSPLWLRHFRFGPAEWLWRSLTYGARQPMRLANPAGETAPVT